MEFLGFLIIGALAGWLAGLLVKGRGFGVLGDMVIGIVGAFLGGLIFLAFGWETEGFWWSLLAALVGSVILLLLVKLFKKEP